MENKHDWEFSWAFHVTIKYNKNEHMKFINYLESITGISIFPLISLIMFTVFFAVVIAYVVTADKKKMDSNSQIPLEQ